MKIDINEFRKGLFKAPFAKRLVIMLIGVVCMGINVAILNMTNFGVDPYAAFCYGASAKTGISFGTMELLVNFILLIAVLLTDINGIGFGTLGNMVVVGYVADFTTYIMSRMGIETIESFGVRVVVMLISLAFFVLSVALYINAGLGGSAYDSLPYIIQRGVSKLLGRDIKFRIVRIAFDAVFTIVAILIKGQAGIITVLMVLTLGPTIDVVAKLLSGVLKLDE